MLEELPAIFYPIDTMGLLPTCRVAFCFGLLWFLRLEGMSSFECTDSDSISINIKKEIGIENFFL